jgi:hypothetical protein
MAKQIDGIEVVDPQTLGMSAEVRWAFLARRWLRRFKPAKRETPFRNVMDMAHDLADLNPAALHDLVKLLLRPMQSSAIVGVVENTAHQSPASIDGANFFFDDRRVRSIDEGCRLELPNDQFRVRLATDVVLPWPWNRQRIANALAGIGTGKVHGEWTQDFSNHLLTLWLPWGIAFVGGGNHSLTAGIVAGEGELVPERVYDMSALLHMIRCDGHHFRDVETGRVVALNRPGILGGRLV